MPAAPEIRLMVADDVPAVAGALARAFYDDPLQAWAVPDASVRLAVLEDVFAVLARALSVPAQMAFTDATRSCGAYWAAPGPPAPLSPDARSALVDLDRRLDPAVGARLQVADRAMRAVRPPTPHFYLQGIGTDPERQHEGLGSALLAPMLNRIDGAGVPTYLESTKEKNLPFYERHGFRVTGTIDVEPDGPRLWSMWRDPAVTTG